MSDSPIDPKRRAFLKKSTVVLGGIGAMCATIPFISSWSPSQKKALLDTYVDVDITAIPPGKKITVPWRGKPVFILHRTDKQITQLRQHHAQLRDPDSKQAVQPDYIQSPFRSLQERFLVVIGLCTHLGCVPLFKAKKGEFSCPCHSSTFDGAGRVYKGGAAQTNLTIPPHYYVNQQILRIGEDEKSKAM